MMKQYFWRNGFHFPKGLTAEQAVAELDRIRAAEKELTARAIVDHSTPEDAVLHGCFEWDNDVAAEKYRLQQANMIPRSIEVRYIEPEQTAIAYTLAKPEDGPRQYYPTEYLISKPDLFADGIKRLRGEMAAAIRSVQQLEQLAGNERDRKKLNKVTTTLQRAAEGLARI